MLRQERRELTLAPIALRSFEHWALTLLRREYDYFTSEEAIIETIEANEYEFDENGNLA